MSQAFAAIAAIIKAIPIIKKWVDLFMVYYFNYTVDKMRKEDRAAIRKAIDEQDQRDLEKQIGDRHPGENSNLPGTGLRDSLPNVVQDPK